MSIRAGNRLGSVRRSGPFATCAYKRGSSTSPTRTQVPPGDGATPASCPRRGFLHGHGAGTHPLSKKDYGLLHTDYHSGLCGLRQAVSIHTRPAGALLRPQLGAAEALRSLSRRPESGEAAPARRADNNAATMDKDVVRRLKMKLRLWARRRCQCSRDHRRPSFGCFRRHSGGSNAPANHQCDCGFRFGRKKPCLRREMGGTVRLSRLLITTYEHRSE